mgnify:CR=1 FL=1|tara:strand:+ start:9718 stop:10161 length:444 start_codon:yes stop_codon:yes gene_type:complete
MTSLLVTALVVHILLGVAAIGLVYFVLIQTLKRTPDWEWSRNLSMWATVLFFISWISAAYYYVAYYGSAVKPVIKAGEYPWAHAVFMEGKEHIFILIPFLTVTLALALHSRNENPKLKTAIVALAATIVVLGIFVTLSGVVVSGAAR